MTEVNLKTERCLPCEGGMPRLSREEAVALVANHTPRWQLSEQADTISRELAFPNFEAAMKFLNQLANVAEGEGHHPDFCLYGWNKVRIVLSTHAIGGLSRNDFILASKLEGALGAGALADSGDGAAGLA